MTNEERDLAIRTILAEAGSQGPAGMLAVANVIKNRVLSGRFGDGVGGVVTKKYAFEPMLHYGTGRGNDPARFSEADPNYQAAARIFDTTIAGGAPDNTNGATHFINAALQTGEGREIPTWAKGKPLATIGGHSFYAPEGQVDSDTPTVDPALLATLASTSTPAGSDAANRFVQQHGSSPTGGQPPIGSTPGKLGGLADMIRMFGGMGGQQQGGQQQVPFLQRMIWGDKGFNGVLGNIHTPNNGQGLLGSLFGTPPGATAPTQAPAGDTAGGPMTAPVLPVQSTPLAPSTPDVPMPTPRPGAGADLTAGATPALTPGSLTSWGSSEAAPGGALAASPLAAAASTPAVAAPALAAPAMGAEGLSAFGGLGGIASLFAGI